MTNSIIKLMIIGDYSIFRSALRMLLETDRKLRVVGEASRVESAADIISEETPDIILVDLPDFGGHDLQPFVQKVKVPILVLVGQHDVGIYQKCLSIGVKGLILKGVSADTLFKAIEKTYSGEMWFDRSIMGETIRQLIVEKQITQERPDAGAATALTERERQVVELICKGMKNKGIAERLFITETTVRHHLTSVFSKLDISSRLELVIYAFKHNIAAPAKAQGNGNGRGNGNGNGKGNGNGNGHRSGNDNKKLRAGFPVPTAAAASRTTPLER